MTIDARVVIDAARDPTRVDNLVDNLDDDDELLQILRPAPPRSVSLAIAGARGVGKTAFVRRFFSESRRTVVGHTDDDDDRSLSSSWRSTPTIGMDYGAVTLASPMTTTPRVRFRFYDPSGAVAHAACRAEAFRAAKAIVVVVDPDARRVDDDNDDEDDDDRAIEGMIDEIVRAREGASDDDEDARVSLSARCVEVAARTVEVDRIALIEDDRVASFEMDRDGALQHDQEFLAGVADDIVLEGRHRSWQARTSGRNP